MATRILILTPDGTPLYGLDGHHGAAHATRWVADTLEMLAGQGIHDCIALQIHPTQGGDDCRRGIIGQIHRLRLETRQRPDGLREITALNLLADAEPDDDIKRVAVSTPERVAATLQIVQAPDSLAGTRRAIRIPRGRMEPVPGTPMDPQAARLHRKLEARR